MAKKKLKKKAKKRVKKPEIVDNSRSKGILQQVYLVWCMHTTGLVSLRAVSLSPKTALLYKKMLGNDLNSHNVIRSWIEGRDLDHLYGEQELTLINTINRSELYKLTDELRQHEKSGG